jgi:hypothetical protein
LREGFWRRAVLDARWTAARRAPRVTRSRDPSLLGFQSPAWGYVFDSYDPASLGHAIEVRHPLMDLRLIRFALGLPAVPWCVNKHLLRECLEGLPQEVRARPKTPLSAHPIAELFRRRGLEGLRAPWRSERLSQFVDLDAVAERLAFRSLADDELEPLLRVVGLGAWLEGRDRARVEPPAADGGVTINPAAPASRSVRGDRPR